MTHYDELLGAVTSNPDNDEARLALAAYLRESERDLAQFIEEQIQEARARRMSRDSFNAANHPLLVKNPSWTRMIAKYAHEWSFDRGFIAKIRFEPYLFLEYGEWLLVNYPAQVIVLSRPDGNRFPIAELAAFPQIAKLQGLAIRGVRIDEAELVQLLESPHFQHLQYFTVDCTHVSEQTYERLAASQLGKSLMLSLEKFGPGQNYVESEREDVMGRTIYEWTDVQPFGKELEKRHGYLPWLHPQQNGCEPLDATWYIRNGVLPVKPAGSPVDD